MTDRHPRLTRLVNMLNDFADKSPAVNRAIADLIEVIATEHWRSPDGVCDRDGMPWPCRERQSAWAVAETLGIK